MRLNKVAQPTPEEFLYRSSAAAFSRSVLEIEPAPPRLKMLPLLPMLRIEPALPMLRMLPTLPMLKMLHKLFTLSRLA